MPASSRPSPNAPMTLRYSLTSPVWLMPSELRAANTPISAPMTANRMAMPPVMTWAQTKPPRFSQYSRLSSHLNLPSGVMW
ncbi:hypothetical protein D3C71_2084780 [compost metagenome]